MKKNGLVRAGALLTACLLLFWGISGALGQAGEPARSGEGFPREAGGTNGSPLWGKSAQTGGEETPLPGEAAQAGGEKDSSLPEEAAGEEGQKEVVSPEFDASQLYAASAALMDADSGRLLFGKNADQALPMASTTKIMTCIVALERAGLEETVDISSYAAGMPKVKLYVSPGEQYRLEDLLYSLMLESHNDAAAAIAEHVGKKYLPKGLREKSAGEYTREESQMAVAAFAGLMNRKARELGCVNTWFITPNGLDASESVTSESGEVLEREHSTTAAELASIMAYCIKRSPRREDFLRITRTASHSFSIANGRSFSCSNHNAFLNMMEGALSGKTGFTNKAGYCYVGALERNGKTFVVALLACGWPNNKTYKWSDTRRLMNFGLEHYTYHSFSEAAYSQEKLEPIPVRGGETERIGQTALVRVRIAERSGSLGISGEEPAGEGASAGEEVPAGEEPAGREAPAGEEKTAGQENPALQLEGLLLKPGESVQVVCRVEKELTAPVEAGRQVGTVSYMVDGKTYRTEHIVLTQGVERIRFGWCLQKIWELFSSI